MVICNIEKVTNEGLLLNKLRENERVIGRFINYELELIKDSGTGKKKIYLTNKNRVIIYDDGGNFSTEKIYVSDIYGLGKYDFNGGYPILIDFPYGMKLSLYISLVDLILYSYCFYQYIDFTKEPTILINKEENIPLKNLALNKKSIFFYNSDAQTIEVSIDSIKSLKYGNRVLNISYIENEKLNKIYVFNLDFEPVKSIKILLDRQPQK